MAGISITVIIGLFAVFLTARFQRKQWLRSTREEIRVRETKSAEELVREVARNFDKRISAQRFYLMNLGSEDVDQFKSKYREAVFEYSSSLNDIRSRLFYYFGYDTVRDFEKRLHNRVVFNGEKVAALSRVEQIDGGSVSELNQDLSVVSAQVYRFCTRSSNKISRGEINPLIRLENWSDPSNEFIGTWFLVRRLLRI